MSKRLGKGLEALISSYQTDEESYVDGLVPISMIEPNAEQPRQSFETQNMNALIESIKINGVLQPISIRRIKKNKYQIIAGERRYRAAKFLNLKTIPAYILSVNDKSHLMELALVENLQRVELNAIEEAEAFAVLHSKHNLSHKEIGKKLGKSRSYISNSIRLLRLPDPIKNDLIKNNDSFTPGHARALLGILKNKKIKNKSIAILDAWHSVVSNGLSVRKTEQYIGTFGDLKNKILANKKQKSEFLLAENEIKNILNTKVQIKSKMKGGQIIISFESKNQLKKLLRQIKNK